MNSITITVDDLTFRYPGSDEPVLRNANVEIDSGEFTAIIGGNGSGKTTLCKAFNRLDMAVWRVLFNLSVTPLPTNGVVGIDVFGFDRSHGSKHYTKRRKLTIQQLKGTLLVDTRSNAIIDLYVTTIRKHDSRISP